MMTGQGQKWRVEEMLTIETVEAVQIALSNQISFHQLRKEGCLVPSWTSVAAQNLI